MHLQESGEMYLETIYVLDQENNGVRAVDVAEYRGYSKPSVSRAVGVLKKGGMLPVDAAGRLHLTAAGEEIARKIYDRFSHPHRRGRENGGDGRLQDRARAQRHLL